MTTDSSGPSKYPRWRGCHKCDVMWFGHELECWLCGSDEDVFNKSRPAVTGTPLYQGRTEEEWDALVATWAARPCLPTPDD